MIDVPQTRVMSFLFSDVEGSTLALGRLDTGYDALLHTHHRLLRAAWAAHGGREVSTAGDSFFVTFDDAASALRAALDAQRALSAHDWPGGDGLRVRIGVHRGEARRFGDDYVGMAVHQAARISAAAHGGQVLVSEDALVAIDGVRSLALGPHRLKDLAAPVQLHQIDDADRHTSFPPPRSLSVLPNNLPFVHNEFVGRGDDIATVADRLDSHHLVTIVGSGGVGKTRLALQVAAETMAGYPDGVWWVDLAPLADPATVGPTVAEVLGVVAPVTGSVVDAIARNLDGRRALVVLDNCEHLIEASARVAHAMLSASGGSRVLATSREALNVDGEATVRLRSLGVPDEGDAAAALTAESVLLFAQRAAAVDASFRLDESRVEAVARICRRLDGLPLAIELAAARVRLMSVDEIGGRLDDRFRLLTGGSRLAMTRQRTLEATVAWSYDLLDAAEQQLFVRLSVFAGGCTLAAARAVAADPVTDEYEVLELLTRLVDKSLVLAEAASGGRTRYRLLETLRQFGRDRLVESGESAAMHDRHLAWVVALARTLPPQTGASLPPEVAEESDNLAAAIEWAIERPDHESAIAILAVVWVFGASVDQRETWFRAVLPSISEVPVATAVSLWSAAGSVSFFKGDWELAAERYEGARLAAAEAANGPMEAFSQLYLAMCLWGLGRDAEALAQVHAGYAVARASGDGEVIRRARTFVAYLTIDADPAAATAMAAELDDEVRVDGTAFELSHTRELFAYAVALGGDLDRGASLMAEALALFEQTLSLCSAHALETAAVISAWRDRPDAGAEMLGAARALRVLSGDAPRPWERTVHEVWLPRLLEQIEPAALDVALASGATRSRVAALRWAAEQFRA